MGRISARSNVYQWLNVLSGAGFIGSTPMERRLSAAFINVVWMAIGAVRCLWPLDGGADAGNGSDGTAARGINSVAILRGAVRPARRLQQRAAGLRTCALSMQSSKPALRDRRRVMSSSVMPLSITRRMPERFRAFKAWASR